MKPKVYCESGYSCCDHPKRIEWGGESHDIFEVQNEWREPGTKHYYIRTISGKKIDLEFCEMTGKWKAYELLNTTDHRSNDHG